jgi:hypothetical protein
MSERTGVDGTLSPPKIAPEPLQKTRRTETSTVFVVALLVIAPLLACKRSRTVPSHHPAMPASPSPIATAPPSAVPGAESTQTEPEPVYEPVIDASRVSDKSLCVEPGKAPDAITKESPRQLLRAMRSALRSVRTTHVYGIAKMEIPEISSWRFEVRASREFGLVYEAARADQKKPGKISIVQLPDGKTYARGRFMFSAHPDLHERIGDRWFEVPEPLLTADAGDAHPEGPQGLFELDIGYKAAIARFAQEAISWYPERQAEWLFESLTRIRPGTPASKELLPIDDAHRHFAGCQSLVINQGKMRLQLSASDKLLPLQRDPMAGLIAGRFRWGEYNEAFQKPTAPKGAVTLASLVAGR